MSSKVWRILFFSLTTKSSHFYLFFPQLLRISDDALLNLMLPISTPAFGHILFERNTGFITTWKRRCNPEIAVLLCGSTSTCPWWNLPELFPPAATHIRGVKLYIHMKNKMWKRLNNHCPKKLAWPPQWIPITGRTEWRQSPSTTWSELGNKEQSCSELQLNYQVRAPTDPGLRIQGRYLLKQEAMTPTADCLIIYNAQRRPDVWAGSQWQCRRRLHCKESCVKIMTQPLCCPRTFI